MVSTTVRRLTFRFGAPNLASVKTSQALKFFGSYYAIAKALRDAGIEIAAASPYDWGETVPELRQLQLEALTGGALKAAPGVKPSLAGRGEVR